MRKCSNIVGISRMFFKVMARTQFLFGKKPENKVQTRQTKHTPAVTPDHDLTMNYDPGPSHSLFSSKTIFRMQIPIKSKSDRTVNQPSLASCTMKRITLQRKTSNETNTQRQYRHAQVRIKIIILSVSQSRHGMENQRETS